MSDDLSGKHYRQSALQRRKHGGFHARIGERKQDGDAKGRIVFEFLTPNDDVYDDSSKKIRMKVSEIPEVDFKIST